MQACLNVFSLNKNYSVFLKEFKKHYLYEKMIKLHKSPHKEKAILVKFLKSEFQIFDFFRMLEHCIHMMGEKSTVEKVMSSLRQKTNGMVLKTPVKKM